MKQIEIKITIELKTKLGLFDKELITSRLKYIIDSWSEPGHGRLTEPNIAVIEFSKKEIK